MIEIFPRSTVGFAGSILFVQESEPSKQDSDSSSRVGGVAHRRRGRRSRTHPEHGSDPSFRLGVFTFPENQFTIRPDTIDRKHPFSSRLYGIQTSVLAWSNRNLGYTISLGLSGLLAPLKPMEDREEVLMNVFTVVFRTFLRTDPERLDAYGRLLDLAWWFC